LKLPISIENDPLMSTGEFPEKVNVIVSCVGDTWAKLKEPVMTGLVEQVSPVCPTQKVGLDGSV